MNKLALLIIDMQRAMQSALLPERNNAGAEALIATLLSQCRAGGHSVVHVRHISRDHQSGFWPGQVGAEFQDALAPIDSEHVVEKNVADAFVNTGLERWLRVRGIDAVAIVGVSTPISVESTARTAGCLGFKTYVVSDATFAFSKTDYRGVLRTASEVHAMSLANMQGEFATILSARELLEQLKLKANRAHPDA